MKRLALVVATIVAAFAAMAGTAGAWGGYVVDSGFACGLYDGSGNIHITYNSVLTVYDSGKVVLQCEAVVGNTTGNLVTFNYENTGATCGMLDFGSTTEWKDRVGRSGESQLTCTTYAKDNIDLARIASASGAGVG